MSKQKNKKFKKAKKQHIYQAQPVQTAAEPISNDQNTQPFTTPAPKQGEIISNQKEDLNKKLDTEYAYVRKDVRLILLTILLLVVLMIVAYFIGQKTTILREFGDWIYRISNFQTS